VSEKGQGASAPQAAPSPGGTRERGSSGPGSQAPGSSAAPTGGGGSPAAGGPGGGQTATTPQPRAGSLAGSTGTGSVLRTIDLPSGTKLVEMSDGRRLAQHPDGSSIPVDEFGIFSDPLTGDPVSTKLLDWTPAEFRQRARDLDMQSQEAANSGDPARAGRLKSQSDWNARQAAALDAGSSSSDAGPVR